MVRRVLKIGHWVVDFLFADRKYDINGVLSCLWDAYAPSDVLYNAEELMLSCKYNCGFTYTNPQKKRAVMLIGPTTSGDEFLNTISHEVRHLADGIAKSLGIELDSESPAYLTGDTVKELAEVICRFGCRNCN